MPVLMIILSAAGHAAPDFVCLRNMPAGCPRRSQASSPGVLTGRVDGPGTDEADGPSTTGVIAQRRSPNAISDPEHSRDRPDCGIVQLRIRDRATAPGLATARSAGSPHGRNAAAYPCSLLRCCG